MHIHVLIIREQVNVSCPVFSLTGAPFKPSVKKAHREVEFAPTNLHLHRIWVQNDTKNTSMLAREWVVLIMQGLSLSLNTILNSLPSSKDKKTTTVKLE